MLTIWKYTLDMGVTSHEIPKGAKVLTVQSQQNWPCIWVMCDTEVIEKETRAFVICGTGYPIKYDLNTLLYIGTFQLDNGMYVGHCFEVKEKK